MKKLYPIIIGFIFIVNALPAQYGRLTRDKIKILKSSTTYFILEQDSDYNAALKEAVTTFWSLGNYEFITYDESERVEGNFVIKDQHGSSGYLPGTGTSRSGSIPSFPIDALVYTVGTHPKQQPDHGQIPLYQWDAYVLLNDGSGTLEYLHKLGSYVQILQNYIKTLEESGKKKLSPRKTKKIYNKSKEVLKTKTLLVCRFDLPVFEKKDPFLLYYKNSYKLETAKFIGEAVKKRDESSLVLHLVYTNRVYNYFVTDTKDGRVVYADWIKGRYFTPRLTVRAIRKLSGKKFI
jgi:hypothetical protein